jgi:hypothetical protein
LLYKQTDRDDSSRRICAFLLMSIPCVRMKVMVNHCLCADSTREQQ